MASTRDTLLGTDFACGPDEDGVFDIAPDLRTVDGGRATVECVARRLQTHKLFYDPSVGVDLIRFSSGLADPATIAAAAEAEAIQDERVRNATWDAEKSGSVLSGEFALETNDGPFEFTLEIGDVPGKINTSGGALG